MSKDRDTKSLQDKLKAFLKKGPTASGATALRQELVVTAELERELSADAGAARRLRAMRDLAERAQHMPMTEGGVVRVWELVRDCLRAEGAGVSGELRAGALRLLAGLAGSQAAQLRMLRTVLLRWLRAALTERAPLDLASADDAALRFKLLYNLTNSGKDISGIEDEICPVCVEWARGDGRPGTGAGGVQAGALLALLTTAVKYNAAYLEDRDLDLLLELACDECNAASEISGGSGAAPALALCEAVAAYALVPRGSLARLVRALCGLLAAAGAARAAWRLLRALLGGAAAAQVLHELLAVAAEPASPQTARAAVWAVGTALWGPRPVTSLTASPTAVLPAFLAAARLRVPGLTCELLAQVQALLARRGHELHELEWDALLAVLRAAGGAQNAPSVSRALASTMCAVERLQDAGAWAGDGAAWCALAERAGGGAGRGAAWRAAALEQAPDWAQAAQALWAGAGGPQRLPALKALIAGAPAARRRLGDEALERGVMPALLSAATDADVALRAAAAAAVPELARTAPPDLAADLLELLERVLSRPFDIYVTDVCLDADADVSDVQAAVDSLVAVLRMRLCRAPGAVAARALSHLVEHLERHYRRPALLARRPGVRTAALSALLALRPSPRGALGWAEPEQDEPSEYSPFLLLEPFQPRNAPVPTMAPLPQGCTIVNASRAAAVLRQVLQQETEWGVLRVVLGALPGVLGAGGLLLGRRPAERDQLAAALCTLVSERGLRQPEAWRGLDASVAGGAGAGGAGGWAALALAALGALAPQLSHAAPGTLRRLARVLLRLAGRAASLQALSLLALEARGAMARVLPELLLDLSKLSDTSQHAAPVLEFLSTLTRLPEVFASFVEDQYMAVFAIVLPYTNPSRYNHYVVSLAHHVIAAWFLKCRLAYRRNLVRFIIHGLHNYILVPFEAQLQAPPASNEDSSTRQRSSSLGSRGAGAVGSSRGGAAGARGPPGGAPTGPPGVVAGGARAGAAEASAAYHVELTETCVDLLARYTFTPCSVKPTRSDTAEVIFRHGQSGTWLVGHRVITISTSRCQHLARGHALCDRCMLVCRQDGDPVPPSPPPAAPAAAAPGLAAGPPAAGQQPAGAHPPVAERQNSGETKSDPVLEALTQRFDNIAKETEGDSEDPGPSVPDSSGVCACWCSAWAYVEVRACTGDVGWLQRVHNRLHQQRPQPALLDARCALQALQLEYEDEMRSRSDSAPQPRQHSLGGEATNAAPRPVPAAQDIVRDTTRDIAYDTTRDIVRDSTSDGTQDAVKDSARSDAPLSRSSTAPINIPRGSAAVDDLLPLLLPAGKSRQPVKRSNSSPEMSSWKHSELGPPLSPPAPGPAPPGTSGPEGPVTQATTAFDTSALVAPPHGKKGGKKNDMRVSCEAIPEEMSGTSPLAPAPLIPLLRDEGANRAEGKPPPPAVVVVPPLANTHHLLQKTASASAVPGGAGGGLGGAGAAGGGGAGTLDELPPLARAKRSNTISVCSPEHRYREGLQARASAAASASAGGSGGGGGGAGGSVGGSSSVGGGGAGAGGGVSPEFVLLQLYHNMSTSPISPTLPGEAGTGAAERPLKLAGAQHERSLKNLDLLPPLDTFKIGVLYVGPGQQDDEVAILSNEYGSVRYCDFVAGLGTAVALTGDAGALGAAGAEPQWLGVERGGKDGQFATVWRDDTLHVQFHIATHMPNSKADPACNEKRKYIGNDPVSIVYNESGTPFRIGTIAGQHNLCVIEVVPRPCGGVRVRLLSKDERVRRQFLPHAAPAAASDAAAARLARQWALHAALAAQLAAGLALGGAPPGSHMLERLRLIKRLRRRALAERAARAAPPPYAARAARPHVTQHIDDFNDYT